MKRESWRVTLPSLKPAAEIVFSLTLGTCCLKTRGVNLRGLRRRLPPRPGPQARTLGGSRSGSRSRRRRQVSRGSRVGVIAKGEERREAHIRTSGVGLIRASVDWSGREERGKSGGVRETRRRRQDRGTSQSRRQECEEWTEPTEQTHRRPTAYTSLHSVSCGHCSCRRRRRRCCRRCSCSCSCCRVSNSSLASLIYSAQTCITRLSLPLSLSLSLSRSPARREVRWPAAADPGCPQAIGCSSPAADEGW